MALYDGLTINSNIPALAYNKLHYEKWIDMVRTETPFFYAITGKNQSPLVPKNNFSFKNINKVDGDKIEMRVLGEYRTPLYITSASDAVTALTASTYYNDNQWGALEFETTRALLPITIPGKELDKISGSSLKYASFIAEMWEVGRLSWAKWFSEEIHKAQAPVEATLGGWRWMISDGLNTGGVDESGYAAYGLLNRADSANSGMRGQVYRGVGDLAMADIRTAKQAIQIAGGKPDFAVCNTIPYSKVKTLIEAYTHTTYDEAWSKFGGEYCSFEGCAFVLDGFCEANTIGIFDSRTWGFWMKDGNVINESLERDRNLKDGFSMPSYFVGQFLCSNPRHNAKLLGVTG